MNIERGSNAPPGALKTLVLAGLAGGIAEVAWVGLYCAVTPLSGAEVLRQVTASALPVVAGSDAAPALGMAIHMGLAIALSTAYGLSVGLESVRRSSLASAAVSGAATLAIVWLINFVLILPLLNPAFVDLMPYPVTLISKLLFGAAMGYVLHSAQRRSAQASLERIVAID